MAKIGRAIALSISAVGVLISFQLFGLLFTSDKDDADGEGARVLGSEWDSSVDQSIREITVDIFNPRGDLLGRGTFAPFVKKIITNFHVLGNLGQNLKRSELEAFDTSFLTFRRRGFLEKTDEELVATGSASCVAWLDLCSMPVKARGENKADRSSKREPPSLRETSETKMFFYPNAPTETRGLPESGELLFRGRIFSLGAARVIKGHSGSPALVSSEETVGVLTSNSTLKPYLSSSLLRPLVRMFVPEKGMVLITSIEPLAKTPQVTSDQERISLEVNLEALSSWGDDMIRLQKAEGLPFLAKSFVGKFYKEIMRQGLDIAPEESALFLDKQDHRKGLIAWHLARRWSNPEKAQSQDIDLKSIFLSPPTEEELVFFNQLKAAL